MEYSFNLVDRPWIPCITLDGESVELSLMEVFDQAENIREIYDPSPLITVSLHRLLLAVLHRVFGPKNLKEWIKIWENKRWDTDRLNEYFTEWRPRFDLFDAKWPFYQVAGFKTKKTSPVSRLLHELASGNNPTLFDHSHEYDGFSMQPAEVARALVMHHAYALSGGPSYPEGHKESLRDAPLVRKLIVLFKGCNLFETLMLNLILYNPEYDEPIPSESYDKPAWEKKRESLTESRDPDGYLDLLTWQSRCIRLIPEGEPDAPLVKQIYYAQGNSFAKNDIFDPQAPMIRNEEKGWRALRFNNDRALWRDSTSIMQLNSEDSRPPAAFLFISQLIGDRILDRSYRYRLSIFGLSTDKAKIHLWRTEEMPLPLAYLADPTNVDYLRNGLLFAEDAGTILYRSLYTLGEYILSPEHDVDKNKKPEKKSVYQYIEGLQAMPRYWSTLELPFLKLIDGIPINEERALSEWLEQIRISATQAFDEVSQYVETSARTMKACVHARGILMGGLKEKLPRRGEVYGGDNHKK